jgi:prepilin-type N-terminal cleavage/methylation domain-containing protein
VRPVTRARREDGFTLVELLVTMLLGTIVLGGLLGLVTTSERASKRVSDRVEAAQRGRTAMERVTQELRATVCLPTPASGAETPPPIVEADATHVKWYANLDASATVDENGDGDTAYDPQQRQLRIVGTAPSTVALVEDRWTGALPIAAGTAASSTRTLIDNLVPSTDAGVAVPYFTYSGLAADGVSYQALTPAEITAAPGRIVRVDVAFRALPTRADTTTAGRRPGADMRTSVYARQVNRNANPPIYGCVV